MDWLKAAILIGAFLTNALVLLPKLTARQQRGLERACQCVCTPAIEQEEESVFVRWLDGDKEIVARWGGGYWVCPGRR